MTNLGIREQAIRYTMRILRTATDWQDGQTALYDHDYYGPWLREQDPSSPEPAQSIIRNAVLDKACDLWTAPAIQTVVLIFFTILADRHYVVLGHYQLGDITILLPIYFLVARPVLTRKDNS